MPVTPSCSWLSALPPILVVLGWIVVNYQNNQRETRKETRASLQDFYKALSELESIAISFHTHDQWNDEKAQAIRTTTERTLRRARMIAKSLGITLTDECKAMRQAITLDNFEKSTYQPQQRDSEIILRIEDGHDCLFIELENAFTAKFLR
jgi:transcription initiation factor TFIIIB Brf1 subunit/transcription initiation factor TFIIB